MPYNRTRFFDGIRVFLNRHGKDLNQSRVDALNFLLGMFEKMPVWKDVLNIFPPSISFDVSNVSTANTIFFSNYFIVSSVLSNICNLLRCQFGVVAPFTALLALVINHVFRIVGWRADFQMGWIAANWVVTNKMSNQFIPNLFACFNLVNKAVNSICFFLNLNFTVAVRCLASLPNPAIFRFVYERIYSFLNAKRKTMFCVASPRAIKTFVFYLNFTQRIITNKTSKCYFEISHLFSTSLENGLIRLARDVQNLWRAVSILPQKSFNSFGLEVVK